MQRSQDFMLEELSEATLLERLMLSKAITAVKTLLAHNSFMELRMTLPTTQLLQIMILCGKHYTHSLIRPTLCTMDWIRLQQVLYHKQALTTIKERCCFFAHWLIMNY